ncbi:MAG: LamG-like jellyroll fold domain-containing protein, partial [Patescibacteria group bacterium]
MKSWRKNFKKAFTIVELIVVGAIFSAAIGSFFGAASISFRAVSKASDKVQAAFLMEEGLEGVRHLRDLSWTHYFSKEELGYERCLYFDGVSSTQKYNFATSTAEIVSRWHLDESSGAPVSDTSTSTNPGTFSTPSWVAGKLNNAASFTGGQYIQTTIPAWSLRMVQEFSAEAWIKLNNTTGWQAIVYSNFAGSSGIPNDVFNNGGLAVNAGKPVFTVPAIRPGDPCCFNWGITYTGAALNTTAWHHVVGTFKSSLAVGGDGIPKLYIDGVLVNTNNTPSPPLTNLSFHGYPFYIGARYGWNVDANVVKDFFNGSVDEVVIYNRALTAGEVKDRYNGHAICRKPALTDADGTSFTRTVKFENVCRAANGDIVAPPNNVTLL